MTRKGADRVPKELADARILDDSGATIRVGDLWKKGPVVLAFLRHFG